MPTLPRHHAPSGCPQVPTQARFGRPRPDHGDRFPAPRNRLGRRPTHILAVPYRRRDRGRSTPAYIRIENPKHIVVIQHGAHHHTLAGTGQRHQQALLFGGEHRRQLRVLPARRSDDRVGQYAVQHHIGQFLTAEQRVAWCEIRPLPLLPKPAEKPDSSAFPPLLRESSGSPPDQWARYAPANPPQWSANAPVR